MLRHASRACNFRSIFHKVDLGNANSDLLVKGPGEYLGGYAMDHLPIKAAMGPRACAKSRYLFGLEWKATHPLRSWLIYTTDDHKRIVWCRL